MNREEVPISADPSSQPFLTTGHHPRHFHEDPSLTPSSRPLTTVHRPLLPGHRPPATDHFFLTTGHWPSSPALLRGLTTVLIPLLTIACLWFGSATPAPLPAPQQTATAIWAAPACDLGLFSPEVAWQAQGSELTAELALVNGSNSACRLRGEPRLTITDAGGQALLVDQPTGPLPTADPYGNAFVLPSRQSAAARLVWRNYCGPQPLGGLFITISLPDHPGQITFEATDPTGLPAFTPPPCADPSAPSIVSLAWLTSPQP